MAMLAERKRKEKWCLNPRGKTWSEDNSKFGQRLLEKMGWNAGQGLGINNQGLTDIIKVKLKDDSKGLGFKDNGEEWLKTTSDYNELLGQLGSSLGEESIDGADLASCLEDRSKKSKARVHYHKFTRGKDLSRYSEKDLASILGPDVVKLKTVDASASDYASNQVNKGSSAEYFSQKKKPAQPSQRDDGVQAESNNLNLSSNNSGENTLVIHQKSKQIKSSEDVYLPIPASELFTEEITKVEKKKKHKKKRAVNSDGEKETEENCVLRSYIENAPKKKKKKKKETENLSSVDSKEENSSIHYEKSDTKNYNDEHYIVLKSFGEPLKKKKNKHIESLSQFEDNKNLTSNDMFKMSVDYSIGKKGSKRKKEHLFDEIQQGLAEQTNSNESKNESCDNVDTSNVITQTITRINKEKHLLATEVRKNVNEGNPIDFEGEVIPRKKKKLHNDSFPIDTVNQEDTPYAGNEKLDKLKKNKTKMCISNILEVPESDKLKKKTPCEIDNNCGNPFSETSQEELIFKTKKKDNKNKKKSESGSDNIELHKEQSLVNIKQEKPSDSGEFLEVLGRKTRLRKIDLLNKPAEHVRYDTEDFMSFIPSGPKNASQLSYPSKTINANIKTNQKLPLRKVHIEPSQQDLELPKSVIILEYRLLTKKLKELNLAAPEMKIIIKDKTLARATCRKLKQLQKSKEIKALLPPKHVAEVEVAVNKYTEELKPKIDMIKKLAEIEKETVLIAEELVDESSLQIKGEKEPSHILDPEKVKVVKQMSKQLKKLLKEKSTEETVKSAGIDQVTASTKRKSDNSAELNSTHKELKLNSEKNECETLDLASKENVLETNSLQKRIEERLKDLSEQMKMLKEGKKPVITPTLQPKPNALKESFTKRVFPNQNFRSFTRRRSHGAPRGGTYSGGSSTQSRTESSRHLFFTKNQNSNSLGDEPDTFEHPGGRGGFGISQRGVRSAVPRGGWGILKSYGMASESAGGFINRGQLSRGSFVRGRTFRGRGRGELLRGRGRISQNNFDAKQYAEKCKQLNKVPEIAFKGVDLGVISGYAASQALESTVSSSKTSIDLIQTSCEFTEVVVSKEQVKNLPDSISQT